MMTKSVFWWRKPEYPEETTDLRSVLDLYTSNLQTDTPSDACFRLLFGDNGRRCRLKRILRTQLNLVIKDVVMSQTDTFCRHIPLYVGIPPIGGQEFLCRIQ